VGVAATCQAAGLFNKLRGVGSSPWEPISISPDGDPLRSATPSPNVCRKAYCYSVLVW